MIAEGRGRVDATGKPQARVSRRHAREPPAQGDGHVLQRRSILEKGLAKGTRLMLSGRGRILQGHNAADASGVPGPRVAEQGRRRHQVAGEDRRRRRGRPATSCWRRSSETSSRSIPASAKVQSWDIYACVRQVLDVLDPIEDPLPENVLRQRNLISEDEALRAIHLAENAAERERARARLDVRRGGRAAVGAGGAPLRRTE